MGARHVTLTLRSPISLYIAHDGKKRYIYRDVRRFYSLFLFSSKSSDYFIIIVVVVVTKLVFSSPTNKEASLITRGF